ncbi:uncharacterized protein BDW43DRAFT_317188 [Aspergillus alliaceus]|uniref:uncharacterized protein n=1 Tax=Petromyces alliaceus TaxID=209559 RepID=UPI0012A65B97|nr:uncharacterized protein BDW43DRAFT_317188 [Aspergillus alliaceus]KAB8227073.1 hypothetical protein BDW43DRAFT_317188 [Aspergillus alliaceus]
MASAKRHWSGRSPAAATVERKRVCFCLEDKGGQVLIQRNWQNVNQEHYDTRTVHPREVLRQVADSMNWQRNELSVTLPAHTTWRAAIRAAEAALGDIDEPMLLMPRGTGNRRVLREMARLSASESPSGNGLGLPIRTTIDLKTVEPRPPLSTAARERLRKMAEEAANTEFRDPYVSLRPKLGESFLPIVRADLVLRGVDSNDTDPLCKLEGIDMIFDAGAHRTIIVEDLLSASFQEYLKGSVHDPYRSSDGSVLQVSVTMAFTNCPVVIETVAVIIPKAKMPNERVGVLFGQSSCIDRLSLRSIPRRMLLAKGAVVSDEFWGDIVAEEYLNLDDEIVSL